MMRFRAGELTFNAESVTPEGEAVSPQTGARLQTLTVQFRARNETMHQQALDAAGARGGLFSLADGDEPETEWRVLDSESTYVGREPWGINHHTWRIEQVERIAIRRLQLGALSLEPYDYREEASPAGALRLAARAAISDEDLRAVFRLCEAREPVEVVRVGVSSEPLRMVVDHYVWGAHEGGQAVALACLEVVPPRPTASHAGPEAVDLAAAFGRQAFARARGVTTELLDLLQAKGLITAEDARGLVDRNRERGWRERHAAREVRDLDAWSL